MGRAHVKDTPLGQRPQLNNGITEMLNEWRKTSAAQQYNAHAVGKVGILNQAAALLFEAVESHNTGKSLLNRSNASHHQSVVDIVCLWVRPCKRPLACATTVLSQTACVALQYNSSHAGCCECATSVFFKTTHMWLKLPCATMTLAPHADSGTTMVMLRPNLFYSVTRRTFR